MRLTLEPLTAEGFAPFGEVLTALAEPGRVYIEAALANRREHAKPSLSFSTKLPATLPLNSTTMERHRHSSQSFVPMDAGRWLVLVAPNGADGGPEMAKARAFLARPDQGVTYGADVWHHPSTVFDQTARFAIVMWKDGGSEDDEFIQVAPFIVTEA
ncbi:ureidoglycolate hydrolase [Roseomonas terrae]|jgi:ureidoglycolate lyase|uniref:Ureidoglycolate hydrolase n=1 Tax=Neoroseomonas terrae TaxID=424799 RepID=A0ABS5ENV8_9PROT|nr:ureidoglycolate lyase [Neoroseomonas terrae]MBR0652703.1 ureidoglycolate hydrolase [Neoroseomonas terrae]